MNRQTALPVCRARKPELFFLAEKNKRGGVAEIFERRRKIIRDRVPPQALCRELIGFLEFCLARPQEGSGEKCWRA